MSERKYFTDKYVYTGPDMYLKDERTGLFNGSKVEAEVNINIATITGVYYSNGLLEDLDRPVKVAAEYLESVKADTTHFKGARIRELNLYQFEASADLENICASVLGKNKSWLFRPHSGLQTIVVENGGYVVGVEDGDSLIVHFVQERPNAEEAVKVVKPFPAPLKNFLRIYETKYRYFPDTEDYGQEVDCDVMRIVFDQPQFVNDDDDDNDD